LRSLLTALNNLSLARQFIIAGGSVTITAAVLIGFVVTDLISHAVTRSAAATTALYVDSVIAPILPDLTAEATIDESVERALDETLSQGALGRRLVSFRLWRVDGTILYSNDKNLMGKVVPPGKDRIAAFTGLLIGHFDEVDDEESTVERATGEPLLEIYNPVLQPWSGQVVAVAEFYERAGELQQSLGRARAVSWIVVALVTIGIFSLLSFIVFKAGKTITDQKHLLNEQVMELSALLSRNRELSTRLQKASRNASTLNEYLLRKIGADLHDGPAQLVAYASLRVDSEAVLDPALPREVRESEVRSIKKSLQDAMHEIRNICRGLVLPEIETLSVGQILDRVASAYSERTGISVEVSADGCRCDLSVPHKICIYRFVQEALNNSWKHAGGKDQRIKQLCRDGLIILTVADGGSGFDRDQLETFSGLGLSGLRERVESIGGRFEISSSANGTRLTMSLNVNEMEAVS